VFCISPPFSPPFFTFVLLISRRLQGGAFPRTHRPPQDYVPPPFTENETSRFAAWLSPRSGSDLGIYFQFSPFPHDPYFHICFSFSPSAWQPSHLLRHTLSAPPPVLELFFSVIQPHDDIFTTLRVITPVFNPGCHIPTFLRLKRFLSEKTFLLSHFSVGLFDEFLAYPMNVTMGVKVFP